MQNSRAASLWTTQSVVTTLTLFALIPMAVVHLTGASLNPLTAAISHYVFLPGGYLMVLLGSVLLAGCGLVIAIELIRRPAADRGWTGADDRRRRAAAVLLISFAVALTLVGLFPTDPPGSPASTASAVLHRIGAAWSFLALPVAGVLVARSSRRHRPSSAQALIRVAAGLLGAVVIFLSLHLTLTLHGSGIPAFGLLERVGFAFMIGYLILLATALRPLPTADLPAAELSPAVDLADTGSSPAAALATVELPVAGRPDFSFAAADPTEATGRWALAGAGRE
jgi:hypothetical protein